MQNVNCVNYLLKIKYRIWHLFSISGSEDIGERGSESTFPCLENFYISFAFAVSLYLAGFIINLSIKCVEVSGI